MSNSQSRFIACTDSTDVKSLSGYIVSPLIPCPHCFGAGGDPMKGCNFSEITKAPSMTRHLHRHLKCVRT